MIMKSWPLRQYFSFFFFLLIRLPPSSTPFPTRRSSDLSLAVEEATPAAEREQMLVDVLLRGALVSQHLPADRSEEHTSELQSHHDLVCRLLLEKKKKKALIS